MTAYMQVLSDALKEVERLEKELAEALHSKDIFYQYYLDAEKAKDNQVQSIKLAYNADAKEA